MPNQRGTSRASVLTLCLENEYFQLASLLLENGAEVDIRNEHGWTPLMWASVKGRIKAVSFLLEKGANIHACNNDGWNAVTGAYFKKRKCVIDLLIEKDAVFGAKYAEAALMSAYSSGYVDVALHLINELKVGANISDDAGLTILAKAVGKADWTMVKVLLDNGADVNVYCADGLPLIALLARDGHDDMIDMFLANNADVHLSSKDGHTAIYVAAKNNQIATVRHLIVQGADVNAQTDTGSTPLIVAASNGYLAMVVLLLELGANTELQTSKGITAKKMALALAPRSERLKTLLDTAFKDIAEKLCLPRHFIDG
jgi:ankyrin repeat protein